MFIYVQTFLGNERKVVTIKVALSFTPITDKRGTLIRCDLTFPPLPGFGSPKPMETSPLGALYLLEMRMGRKCMWSLSIKILISRNVLSS